MTCIVAIKHNDLVYMGADSAGSNGQIIRSRVDGKLFKVGEFLIGFTSSFRMGQLIKYGKDIPKCDTTDHLKFMSTDFIEWVRQTLGTGGYSKVENNQETGGTFLVGFRGEIYCIESDYQVGVSIHPFEAVGSGAELAMGSLFTTAGASDMEPRQRMEIALAAASTFCPTVRGPFIFESM